MAKYDADRAISITAMTALGFSSTLAGKALDINDGYLDLSVTMLLDGREMGQSEEVMIQECDFLEDEREEMEEIEEMEELQRAKEDARSMQQQQQHEQQQHEQQQHHHTSPCSDELEEGYYEYGQGPPAHLLEPSHWDAQPPRPHSQIYNCVTIDLDFASAEACLATMPADEVR